MTDPKITNTEISALSTADLLRDLASYTVMMGLPFSRPRLLSAEATRRADALHNTPTPQPDDLGKLSAGAAKGEWLLDVQPYYNEDGEAYEEHVQGVMVLDDEGQPDSIIQCSERDAAFIVALVNAYRTGRLVPAPAAPQATEEPVASAAEIEAAAKQLYDKHTDDAGIHSNRFPSWRELSEKTRAEWRAKVPAPAAPQATEEPVAWAYESGPYNGVWGSYLSRDRPEEATFRRDIRPLYAAPAASRIGVSEEEIARTIYELDPLSVHGERVPWREVGGPHRAHAFKVARAILALLAAPRAGGETGDGEAAR